MKLSLKNVMILFIIALSIVNGQLISFQTNTESNSTQKITTTSQIYNITIIDNSGANTTDNTPENSKNKTTETYQPLPKVQDIKNNDIKSSNSTTDISLITNITTNSSTNNLTSQINNTNTTTTPILLEYQVLQSSLQQSLDEQHFWAGQIRKYGKQLEVHIRDQNLNKFMYELSPGSDLEYVDSYRNFILVKKFVSEKPKDIKDNQIKDKNVSQAQTSTLLVNQGNQTSPALSNSTTNSQTVNTTANTVSTANNTSTGNPVPPIATPATPPKPVIQSYILYQIVYVTIDGKSHLDLQFFIIDPNQDNQGYQLNKQGYVIKQILQNSELKQQLIVSLFYKDQSYQDFQVYKIDYGKKDKILYAIGWFEIKNHEKIIGGNSKVLVDGNNQQFLFDTDNSRNSSKDPTVYKRVNIKDMTALSIYQGSSNFVRLADSYFYFYSQSVDNTNFTGCLFSGNEDQKFQQQTALDITKSVYNTTDHYNYFILVTETNVLWVNVQWSETQKKYISSVITVESLAINPQAQKLIIKDFLDAFAISFLNHRLYLFSAERIQVYNLQLEKTYQATFSKSINDLTETGYQKILAAQKIFIQATNAYIAQRLKNETATVTQNVSTDTKINSN